jgi:hypothetical protein
MPDYEIKFDENWDRVKQALRDEPAKAFLEINGAIEKSIIRVHRNALVEAPVNKQSGGGNLRQMISKRTSGLFGEVVSGAKYSIYVHGGTNPHPIEVKSKRVLANKRTGQVFGTRVNHPGTKANPFLARAVQDSLPEIKYFFAKALENIAKL